MMIRLKERNNMACEEIENLNIQDHQSLVDILFKVQAGNVSCRRAATEILKQVPDVSDKALLECAKEITWIVRDHVGIEFNRMLLQDAIQLELIDMVKSK